MTTYPLEIHDLCKNFGLTPAICGLDLTVRPGEILTLLGPSGCGKTTTLRLVAGFERPDEGQIVIDGRVAAGPGSWMPPEQRGVGMVFQDYALFPHLTVGENVAFGLGRWKGLKRRQRAQEMLHLVGLEGLESRYPHHLSGGQQQRVALARALAPEPALVLMDEPFSNLDASLRVQMRSEVRRILKESGAAAIFVTHDQKDALAVSDRIAVMNTGRLEQVGTPQEIYQFPGTSFVARFVGHTTLLPGEVSLEGEQTLITPIGPIPCGQNHGYPRGARVVVSIRPESIQLDPLGPLVGIVRQITYSGSALEAQVDVQGLGAGTALSMQVSPTTVLAAGQPIRLRVLPDFVSVVGGQPAWVKPAQWEERAAK